MTNHFLKLNLFLATLLFFTYNSVAQEKSYYYNLLLGSRSIEMSPGELQVIFVDNSPSRDVFTSRTTIEQFYNRIGVHFGFEYKNASKFSHLIFWDITTGPNEQFFCGYGLGRDFWIGKRFLFTPSINIAYGRNRYKLGNIKNNSDYIQIREAEYYQSAMKVKLNSNMFLFGPELKMKYPLNKEIKSLFLVASVAYDYSLKSKYKSVVFIPNQKDDERYPHNDNSSIKTDNSNLSLQIDGQEIENYRIQYNAPRFSIGIAFLVSTPQTIQF